YWMLSSLQYQTPATVATFTLSLHDALPIYCKVDGMWENHTNTTEAETIVGKVFEILQRWPNKEIGVVTFNAPQQMLVMDFLEAEDRKSTRLNSSHVKISYAVFCLKKNKQKR